nr:MAG: hypothetical protein [Aedes japonicus narnavirus 1]
MLREHQAGRPELDSVLMPGFTKGPLDGDTTATEACSALADRLGPPSLFTSGTGPMPSPFLGWSGFGGFSLRSGGSCSLGLSSASRLCRRRPAIGAPCAERRSASPTPRASCARRDSEPPHPPRRARPAPSDGTTPFPRPSSPTGWRGAPVAAILAAAGSTSPILEGPGVGAGSGPPSDRSAAERIFRQAPRSLGSPCNVSANRTDWSKTAENFFSAVLPLATEGPAAPFWGAADPGRPRTETHLAGVCVWTFRSLRLRNSGTGVAFLLPLRRSLRPVFSTEGPTD